MLELLRFITCEKDIPSLNKIPELLGGSTLLILDDLMLVATKSRENLLKLNSLSMKYCHHLNMSKMFISQDILYGKGKLRQAKSNSKYMVMFDNKGNQQNWHLIFHNKKINEQEFCKIITDVFMGTYNYLVFHNNLKN